jgi:hypothetical protein
MVEVGSGEGGASGRFGVGEDILILHNDIVSHL